MKIIQRYEETCQIGSFLPGGMPNHPQRGNNAKFRRQNLAQSVVLLVFQFCVLDSINFIDDY
jgi:hypothetical protein